MTWLGHSSMKIITPPSSMFRNQPQHSRRFLCHGKNGGHRRSPHGGQKLRRSFRAPEFGCAKACVLKGKPSNHQALSTLKSRNEPSRPISPQLTVQKTLTKHHEHRDFFHKKKKAVHHLEARAIIKGFFLGIAY